MARYVVVTDSTAALTPEEATAAGITVLGLPVTIDGATHIEGEAGAMSSDIVSALVAGKSVSTSRPAPAALVELYDGLATAGVSGVLALHLSAHLSGTVDSARLAARQADPGRLQVEVLDAQTVGPALGFAAKAAARALAGGASLAAASEVAAGVVAASRSYFYVDTLEHLRRGGRIGAAAAVLGTALAVKPLLTIEAGEVVVAEKVRTSARALARLEELAAEAASDIGGPVEVVVAHLDALDRATAMAGSIAARLATQVMGEVPIVELGAALGAHVGPGMVAVCVVPADEAD